MHTSPQTRPPNSPWPTPETNQLHAIAILHYSMYLAGPSLSLSLHVCVLPIVVQEAAHLVGYAYLPGSIFCIHRIHTPFIPFCKGCANAPRRAQATGRALCAPKMARAHNARTTPKTRCRIPPVDSLSRRCPVPSIQRPIPDSSTALRESMAQGLRARRLLGLSPTWPAVTSIVGHGRIHRPMTDCSTALLNG